MPHDVNIIDKTAHNIIPTILILECNFFNQITAFNLLYHISFQKQIHASINPLALQILTAQIVIQGAIYIMKATGIVRRIDDLGRVVIPKEIRRTMRIREGDPLLTTLTPIDRFCWAIHSVVERYDYSHTH